MNLIAVDIGGTHARFALAHVDQGQVVTLGPATTLKVQDHADLLSAWRAFTGTQQATLPEAAAIAIASPVQGDMIQLTNNDWTLRPAHLSAELGLRQCMLVNDFAAIGHAVAQASDADFTHLSGPDGPLPRHGTIGICGPGTGLGVAGLSREGEDYRIFDSEGGHQDFAPEDAFEDHLLRRLRALHGHVSAERVVSGPGIVAIHAALADMAAQPISALDDWTLWRQALAGEDDLAVAAMTRFCMALGAFAGNVALMQRADAVVIGGGLGLRLRDQLLGPAFRDRFIAKGRFAEMMRRTPVKLITHPEPGLLGAAAAYARASLAVR